MSSIDFVPGAKSPHDILPYYLDYLNSNRQFRIAILIPETKKNPESDGKSSFSSGFAPHSRTRGYFSALVLDILSFPVQNQNEQGAT